MVEGHQQTAAILMGDVLTERLPIADGPLWAVDAAPRPGLGVEVDEALLARWHEWFREVGQYRPWQPHQLAAEDPGWHARGGVAPAG